MLQLVTFILFPSLLWSAAPQSLYEITAKDISGKPVAMSQYKGKVLLIVNTASQCGFTPQMKDLENLYEKYQAQGFEVLAFPSNDFKQDPADNAEISSFAKKNYKATFPLFDKASVTGDHKQPVYQFLSEQKTASVFKEVQWNFEKFLVGRDGKVIDRWRSITKPSAPEVVSAIETALKAPR